MMDTTLQRKLSILERFSSYKDEELLLLYREQGDKKAFDELVHRYERELYNYLRRYTGDSALAEDAFQNTFLQLHLKCDQFKEGARLRPWLYTIATHQAIDAMRKTRRHQMVSLDRNHVAQGEDLGSLMEVLAGGEKGPGQRLQEVERQGWIRKAVNQLPDHLRSVVLLAYYQGLKYREIAEALEVPVGTVKSRLHAAINKLHDAWKRSGLAGDS